VKEWAAALKNQIAPGKTLLRILSFNN